MRKAGFAKSDTSNGPFWGESWTLVLSQFGIMFFDDPIAALQNIQRQMNRGGRVAFTVWRDQEMSHCPGPIVAKYLSPAVAIVTSKRVETWSDPAFTNRVLTAAGFNDVHVVEHTIDAEVPPDTDVPESTWIGSIGEEYRDAVLADWREDRSNLVLDPVMRFELRMFLVTAQLSRFER